MMHTVIGDGGAAGTATVTPGTAPLAKIIAKVMGFPSGGEHDLHVAFVEDKGTETWIRDFSGHQFKSQLTCAKGQLVERFGPMQFTFDMRSTPSGLEMTMRR